MRPNILALIMFSIMCGPIEAEAGCEKWTTTDATLDGGYKKIQASICTMEGSEERTLYVICDSTEPRISFSDTDGFSTPTGRQNATFIFDTGEISIAAEFQYSEYEGILVSDLPLNGQLITLLKKGRSFTFGELGAGKAPLTFSLEGSAAALMAVERSCGVSE